jgi:hypothetical protein
MKVYFRLFEQNQNDNGCHFTEGWSIKILWYTDLVTQRILSIGKKPTISPNM